MLPFEMISYELVVDSCDVWFVFFQEPALYLANSATCACQDSMLSTTALLRAAFGDLTTIDSLFNMLLDPDTRSFAILHIIHIMKADGLDIRQNFDQFFKLYERYLDTLLRVPTETDNFELELLLLNGTQSIITCPDMG